MRLLICGVVLGLVSCGGSTGSGGTGSGGASGGGSGGSSGAGGGSGVGGVSGFGGMPAECQTPATDSGPFAVTFVFHNLDSGPVWLGDSCGTQLFQLLSCADGYQNPIPLDGACTMACSNPNAQCIDCPAVCQLTSVEIPGDTSHSVSFDGMGYVFGALPEGCQCHQQAALPAGKYMLRVPIFTSDQAVSEDASIPVVQWFDLPVPGGVLDVPVSAGGAGG
jgi:hypothetical protein